MHHHLIYGIFNNQTLSLHLYRIQPHLKVSPTNLLTAPLPKMSPQNSVNGQVLPALLCNHMNVDYVSSINQIPTRLATVNDAPTSQAALQLLNAKQDSYDGNYLFYLIFFLNFVWFNSHGICSDLTEHKIIIFI